MAFGFGEDKKFFGGFGTTNSSAEPARTVESAPEQAPLQESVASPQVVVEEKDTMDVKIGEYTSKISDVEGKIKDIYCELGEKYFNLHKDDAEYDLVSLVNAVKDKNALITDFRNKINEIKGIVICDKCGAETKNTSTFCIECGNKIKKVTESAPSGQRACTNCNCFIDEGAKFCPICGYKVESVAMNVSQAILEADKKMDDLVERVTETVAKPVEEKFEEAVEDIIEEVEETVEEPVTETVEAVQDAVEDTVEEDDYDDVLRYGKMNLSFGGEPKECPSCGQQLESFDTMCFACGRKLVN